jgi:hypothetical protein
MIAALAAHVHHRAAPTSVRAYDLTRFMLVHWRRARGLPQTLLPSTSSKKEIWSRLYSQPCVVMHTSADSLFNAWLIHPSFLTFVSTIFIAVLSFVYLPKKHDSREPSYVYPSIPFIGHVVGMMRYGAKYFEIVRYVFTVELTSGQSRLKPAQQR